MRARQWNEGDDVRLAALLTDPAKLFVDIGANAGLYAWVASRAGADVVAIEPHPGMAQRLRTRLPQIEVVEVALSHEAGVATLFVPSVKAHDVTTRSSLEEGANEGFEHRTYDVEMKRLDDVLASRSKPVGFLKIDVEGHEDRVLDGATNTLAEDRPVILIEIEWRHHPRGAPRLIASLEEAGYSGGFVLDGTYRPIADFDHDVLQSPANLKGPGLHLGKRPVYVNNFVFVHTTDERAHERLRASRWAPPVTPG
jgi:FkbM family methyltransferase